MFVRLKEKLVKRNMMLGKISSFVGKGEGQVVGGTPGQKDLALFLRVRGLFRGSTIISRGLVASQRHMPPPPVIAYFSQNSYAGAISPSAGASP